VDFHGEKHLNQTHASNTDPEARLFKKDKGKEAKLCCMGHVLMENRHGLINSPGLAAATGTAERESAVRRWRPSPTGTSLTWAGTGL
jgi:hypothetical protein